ncbi:DUF3574 domain-containing protein [Kribbella sp. NPDC006257]|uniref:DUF3574 domain-containing protein n=1 Tax=Kribbella sp. NPDC006257 TaxID=3156738 RepID=UPI0033A060C5
MMNLAKKTATATLIATALVTPTAVALNHTDDNSSTVKLYGDTMVRTELFFGTDKPGPDVTDWQFQQFINKTITPRFPLGLTVLSGNGQWQEDNGSVTKERSKVVVLIYSLDEQQQDSKKIEEIRDKYKKQFQQESVLRTDTTEQVSF